MTQAQYDASLMAAYNLGRSDATAKAAAGTYATPRVKSLARDLGVELAKVKGSGVAGRVTPGDVRAAAPSAQGRAPHPAVAADTYPAHWDTSAVDANDADAKPTAGALAPRTPKGAGTAYPAHWKL